MAKSKGAKEGDEAFREELKVLLEAQAEWTEELQRLSEQRDAMMQKAQGYETSLEAERQVMEDLERECHSLELRHSHAKEEEENSQTLASNISVELQKFATKTNGKGGKNGKGKARKNGNLG